MYGISIDDDPDAPVGTPAVRRTKAIHWSWTTEYTHEQIASALGVTRRTVENYLADGPTDDVKEKMDHVEGEVRMIAVAELKSQLQAAGHRSRSAENPVKVWPEDGSLHVVDVRDPETGRVEDKYPLPEGFEIDADKEARFYARQEVREILDQLVDLVGAAEPDKQEIEHSGQVDQSVELDSESRDAIRDALNDRYE